MLDSDKQSTNIAHQTLTGLALDAESKRECFRVNSLAAPSPQNGMSAQSGLFF
jgi:hypothetical protein